MDLEQRRPQRQVICNERLFLDDADDVSLFASHCSIVFRITVIISKYFDSSTICSELPWLDV